MTVENLRDLGVHEYAIECVDLEPLSLEEEFVRLPADLAYWNAKLSQTAAEYQRAKFHREQVAGRLHVELREELMVAAREAAEEAAEEALATNPDKKPPRISIKSPTVDDIKSAVVLHEEYVGARELEIEKEQEKSHEYGIVDAIRCKRDMLVQIGANRRAEMQGDPQLRTETRDVREARSMG